MSEANSSRTRIDLITAKNLVRSLIDYHWHQTGWSGDEISLLKELFLDAQALRSDLDFIFIEGITVLPSLPAGTNSPHTFTVYLLRSAENFSTPATLAENLGTLYYENYTQLTVASINDCIEFSLQQMTTFAFQLYSDDIKKCEDAVHSLQKFLFFQGSLLRDLFSNSESFSDGGFDETTGLPNHQTIIVDLVEILKNRRQTLNPLAVMVIHISVSHITADATAYAQTEMLFAQAADRLKAVIQETDVVGRLSRDEFLIIFPKISSPDLALLAASKITKTLEDPFNVNNRFALAKPSLGISLFPDHGKEAETLLHHAEVAQDIARAAKQRYAIYNEDFHRENRLRRSLEKMLHMALEEDQLEIYFQPQADLNTGKITGVEALLRWNVPESGSIPPLELISVAEESGLISLLTMWVFNTSLRHWAEFKKLGIEIDISINITPSNLLDPELIDFISQSLSTWGVPAGKLTIELTESTMIGDNQATINALNRLKSLGLALSIDDFGTGYSSLAYLKKMPLNELKIDKGFIKNMLFSNEDERIVRSIIDLARNFDLRIVAEGVENLSTLEFTRKLGCDAVQGYLISKPLPFNDFADWWLKRKGLLIKSD